MPPRSATFCITSRDLGTSFEIRWVFTDACWHATVHPMGGSSRRCSGRMDDPFGVCFADVFGLFDASHLITEPASGD